MRMNTTHRGQIAGRPLDLPLLRDKHTGIERPASPLSLMDRMAVWLSSSLEEVRTIRRDSIPKYDKGTCKDLDRIQLPGPLSYFRGDK